MGQRRMFSQRIINSAKFLKMSPSAQNLYFHLGMRADDDGVVEAYPIIQMLGAAEDDISVLLLKKFVKPLNNDMVLFITDWLEHNLIRADRKVDSIYKDLLLKMVPEVEYIDPKPRADTLKGQNEIPKALERGYGLNEIRNNRSELPYSFNYKIKLPFIGRNCPLCDEIMTENGKKQVSLQHNKPISLGGKNEIDNISIICFECNMKNKTKDTGKANNEDVREVWNEIIGQSNDNQRTAQVKLSKVKIREDKEEENQKSFKALKEMPTEKITEFADKYRISQGCVKSRIEDLVNYCEMHGKRYKNYDAALRTFIKSHIQKHPDDVIIPSWTEPKREPLKLTLEQRAKKDALIKGMSMPKREENL